MDRRDQLTGHYDCMKTLVGGLTLGGCLKLSGLGPQNSPVDRQRYWTISSSATASGWFGFRTTGYPGLAIPSFFPVALLLAIRP